MALYHFNLGWPVVDVTTGELVRDRGDGQMFDASGNPVITRNSVGVASPVSVGPHAITARFTAEVPFGMVRFGKGEAPVYADETFTAAETAAEAKAAAQAALDQLANISLNAQKVSYIERSPDGRVYFTSYPVLEGGGQPVVRADGTAYIEFP